jgi:hypothetical protein
MMANMKSRAGLWAAGIGLLAISAITLWGSGCNHKDDATGKGIEVDSPSERPEVATPPVRFVDITRKAGIRFMHVNGAFGKKLLPETLGSGVAFIDYDKDKRQDLILVNSCYWPGHADPKKKAPTLALYRNKGDGTFEDVTEQCGLNVTLYGMGVTVGDYDNDGWPDIFVTALGGNKLFHNEPDGKGGRRFVDVTVQAGLATGAGLPSGPGEFLDREAPILFPSSAAWLDYDNDGRLDLFVCHYVTWSPRLDLDQKCTLLGQVRAYCPPRVFKGSQCTLYRNLGGGKFEDVSVKAGIHVTGEQGEAVAKALGVVVGDFDGDGWPDIFVANDTVRNFLFHNRGDGTFEEIGERAGIARAEGVARAGMGADFGEFRAGRFAVVVGNFANEPNTLLCLDHPKQLLFSDVALVEGLAGLSRIVLKFGLFFFDFDLDGLLDLLTCNGHLEPEIQFADKSQTYKQPVQLYWNSGGRPTYALVKEKYSGPDLFRPIVGRGCAFADINGDGYLDVVVTENGGPARLFRNQGGTGHHWVRLELEGDGVRSNKSAIGARVTLTAGGKTQVRFVTSARGYLSQSELPITFGLGKTDKIDRVEIRWPGRGGVQVLQDLAVDNTVPHRITQKPK